MERAGNFRRNLASAIAAEGYGYAGLTVYPSDEDLFTLRQNPSFSPFVELIWRKRAQKIAARKAAEDTRDAGDLRRYLQRQGPDRLLVIARDLPEYQSARTQQIAREILAARADEDLRDRSALEAEWR